MHSSSTVKYSQDKNLPELSELCHTLFFGAVEIQWG